LCRSGLILAKHFNLPERSEDDISSHSVQLDDDKERARILKALEAL